MNNLIKWKTKLFVILLVLFFFFIKKEYLIKSLTITDFSTINEVRLYLNQYSNIKPLDSQISLLKEFKKKILKLIMKKKINRRTNDIKSLFINVNFQFGNLIIFLNKIFFYCEIIGCEYIILSKNKFWFINNTINIKYKNMTIKKGKYTKSKNSFALNYRPWRIYQRNILNIQIPIKVHFLKSQIINNLPVVITNRDELYIHVRSGDIFTNYIHSNYAQPPFCFYSNILKKFRFRKVLIISKDSFNPIIPKLLKKFPQLKQAKNSLKDDVSILINAYNIVCSISSFLIAILQLNSRFEFVWDYNIYKITEKMLHFHFDFNKFPHNNFTIFRMEPSLIYQKKMYKWKNTKSQLKLMLKEKCLNEFTIIKKEN